MRATLWFRNRSFRLLVALAGLALLSVTSLGATSAAPPAAPPQGGLDPRIREIMSGPFYRHAEWGLLEVDPSNGRTLNSLTPTDRLFLPGSTAKVFSVSAALDDLGFDHRFVTPIYGLGQKQGEIFAGNLVLVAQGDLTLGGRTKPDGTVDFTSVDHTYANDIPGATLTPEDPLAGLNQLAQQVRASGITQLNGDVVVDDRLFHAGSEFPVVPVPMILNDNLIDIVLTPGRAGEPPASVTWRPHVAPYHLDVQVKTVAAGQPTALTVQPFPDGRILVTGDLAADAGPVVRVSEVQDAAAFARTALIEALGRAGVTVSANPTGPNPAEKLPSDTSYQGASRVAAYSSPPFREYGKLILKVSHNFGANLVVCLMAAKAGSTDCAAGFPVMASFFDRVHVDRDQVVLSDGQGGNPADRITPQAAVQMLTYWLGRPEAAIFRQMLPIMGVDGSLADVCKQCPGKGKVFAKTGTVFYPDLLNSRGILAWADAGYLEAGPGKYVVYDLVVNGALVPDFNGVLQVNEDLGTISSMLQQEAARPGGARK